MNISGSKSFQKFFLARDGAAPSTPHTPIQTLRIRKFRIWDALDSGDDHPMSAGHFTRKRNKRRSLQSLLSMEMNENLNSFQLN